MAKRVFIPLTAIGLFLAGALASLPAEASAKGQTAPSNEQAQIDGILDGVSDDLWKEVDVYWHHGDYPRIVDLDRVIVEIDPGFQECYSTGGWLMDSLGRRSDAEAFYQLSTKRNGSSAGPYYDLGMFYTIRTKNYPAAVYAFSRAVATNAAGAGEDKNRMLSAKMLAHSYEHAGKLVDALKTWQDVKRRWPNAAAVDSNLKRVQAKVNATSAG